MTKSTHNTASQSAGEVTDSTGDGQKVEAYLIPFNQIEISKWNRSRGIPMDEQYITKLAADIRRNGLMHPVTLVKTADGSGYRIVAGANRVAALRKLHGDASGLRQTEFKVREDLNEDDEKCLAVSISENHHRRTSSVYETAVYVNRLINDQKVDQGKLARMLSLDRPKVNRLQKLTGCFDHLPDSWRKDLNTSATTGAGSSGVFITFTHWYEVAGQIETEITPAVTKVLENAYTKQWSTRELREHVRTAAKGEEPGKSDAPQGSQQVPSKKVARMNPIEVLKAASQHLRLGGELVKAKHAEYAGDVANFALWAETVDAIVTRLEAKKADDKAKSDAGKAQKLADREAKKANKAAQKAQRKAATDAKKASAAAKRAQKAEAATGGNTAAPEGKAA